MVELKAGLFLLSWEWWPKSLTWPVMLCKIWDMSLSPASISFFFFLLLSLFIFNCRIIQYCVFSAIHQHGSAIGIHVFSPSWALLPPPTPSFPSRLSQSPNLNSLSHIANSHWLHYIYYPASISKTPPFFLCIYTPNLILVLVMLHSLSWNSQFHIVSNSVNFVILNFTISI